MNWSAIVLAGAALLAATEPASPGAPARAAAAYPIRPVTLRQLVIESDAIVSARVRADETQEARPLAVYDETPQSVVLEIDQVLKGDVGKTAIRYRNETMICPAPARYVPGTRALAFLFRVSDARTSQPDGFGTVALSYGSKRLSDADLAVYVERVKEQLAIAAMAEGPERLAAQVEWLVRCAEQRATRWEGAYDLAPQPDPRPYEKSKRPFPWAASLTPGQRQRLLDTLLNGEDSYGSCDLERLFKADRDPQVLDWLVTRLRESVSSEKEVSRHRWTQLARQIAYHDSRPTVAAITSQLDDVAYRSGNSSKLPLLVVERRRLGAELLALFPP